MISDGIRKDFKLCNETSVSLPETEEVMPVQRNATEFLVPARNGETLCDAVLRRYHAAQSGREGR